LLAFVLGVLTLLLLVQGVTLHGIGASSTPTHTGAGTPLAGEGPILGTRDGHLRRRAAAPGRRIALSFDDGPDGKWTPRIAAELRRLHVPATFFVVGGQVARHPGIVRDLLDQGFEIGGHTFTHADPASLPGWALSLEMSATSSAVAGAAGVRPRLFRPPYSASAEAVTDHQLPALERIARDGSVLALADFDGRDWDPRRSPATIAASAVPNDATGGIVLLHDGGGDRRRTLAAIPSIVATARARGFRFVTVGDIAGLAPAVSDPPATGWQRLRGRLLLITLGAARLITLALTLLLIPIAILSVLRALVIVVLARRHARRRQAMNAELAGARTLSASIIVPAYNESVGIERAVRSLVASEHPEFEVIVVDDGSLDGTGDLVEALGLDGVRVIRQANAGKPAALNRGIAAARHEAIVMVDGDTVFEPDSLSRVVAPLALDRVGAVSGNTKVGNRGGLLGRWQHIEYVMGFNLDRRMYDVLRCMPTVPGAIGAFKRDALSAVGGLATDTLAEDTDLTIAIGRAGWDVVYAEEARAWTEAPASLSALWRQRYRWSYGTMQAVWKHRSALWNKDEHRIGRRGLPYLVLFQILLPLIAPLIDLFAIYGLVFLDPVPVFLYWVAFNLLQLGLGVYAFRLDGESPRPLWAMPLQQFVYRQLMYLVVIESVISALAGRRLRWQHMERTGEVEVGS
jgi:cellulose synthase/poly-beta-1,6-N-acetylglucosamine synthase-like glycosyltransferase/peptidoglycan/xylan/chitin deacetylase (PgdA/CDA1 family)